MGPAGGRTVAVKVIDDRGNELIAMRTLDKAVWPGEQKNGKVTD